MRSSSSHRVQAHPLRRAGVASLVLAVAYASHARTSQAETQNPPADPPATSTEPAFDPVAILLAAEGDDARRQVARGLLQRFTSDASLAMPDAWLLEQPAASLRLLGDVAATQEDFDAVAAGIVRAMRIGGGNNGAGIRSLDVGSADARAACLTMLARSNDPAAAELLVSWLESASARDRGPIVASLVAMTGRADLGDAPDAWRQWLTRHRHLPPIAWRALLARGLRERAESLDQRERDLLRTLVETTRRLYAALPATNRPAALARMLQDAEPAIRLAATDILLRELERGVMPSSEVSTAVVALLDDPQASIRQAAAVLVDRIVPEGSAVRLSVALRQEQDPDVAAVMLRAFRRSPDATAIDAVLRWLEHGEPTRVAAMRAILSLLEAGFQPNESQRGRVLAQLDPQQSASLTPAGVQVLARLGGRPGLEIVRSLLFSARPEIRRAASEALLSSEEFVDDLLVAAEADPALLQRAADAIAMHKPWAGPLRRVATLEARSTVDASASEPLPITASLARLLSMQERLAAAQTLAGHPTAIRAVLGAPSRPAFVDGPAGDRDFARARFLLGLPEPEPEPQPEAVEVPQDATAEQDEPAAAPPG
ncbi:MAG: hypothetical protein RIE77_08290 [Phycisphaerales bacterium]